MSIEVRQLTIKSFVAPQQEKEEMLSKREWERMKEELLAECRRMVADMLRSERER